MSVSLAYLQKSHPKLQQYVRESAGSEKDRLVDIFSAIVKREQSGLRHTAKEKTTLVSLCVASAEAKGQLGAQPDGQGKLLVGFR